MEIILMILTAIATVAISAFIMALKLINTQLDAYKDLDEQLFKDTEKR